MDDERRIMDRKKYEQRVSKRDGIVFLSAAWIRMLDVMDGLDRAFPASGRL